jgi:hypothetical protein
MTPVLPNSGEAGLDRRVLMGGVPGGEPDFEWRDGGEKGFDRAVVRDKQDHIRAQVCLDTHRTESPHRITVPEVCGFQTAHEARKLAAALLWAADASDAIDAPRPNTRGGG